MSKTRACVVALLTAASACKNDPPPVALEQPQARTAAATAAQTQEPAAVPVPPPIPDEWHSMLVTLRALYPLAWDADEEHEIGTACERKKLDLDVVGKKACADRYDRALAKLHAKIPSESTFTGCSLTVATSVRAALDAAIAEAGPLVDRRGIGLPGVYSSLDDCSKRLFRCESERVRIPCVTQALLQQLGMADDDRPSETTYKKPRNGALFLADSREIDRHTLAFE